MFERKDDPNGSVMDQLLDSLHMVSDRQLYILELVLNTFDGRKMGVTKELVESLDDSNRRKAAFKKYLNCK